MANKTYRGSCHCKKVQFEATVDLSQGTNKCNCTLCWKRRWWTVSCKPEHFKTISGESEMSGLERSSGFCKHCGVHTYVRIPKMDWNEGAYVSISLASFDDLDPTELANAPVSYLDGRRDDWFNVPAETRHL